MKLGNTRVRWLLAGLCGGLIAYFAISHSRPYTVGVVLHLALGAAAVLSGSLGLFSLVGLVRQLVESPSAQSRNNLTLAPNLLMTIGPAVGCITALTGNLFAVLIGLVVFLVCLFSAAHITTRTGTTK